jgi:hypothetical protein
MVNVNGLSEALAADNVNLFGDSIALFEVWVDKQLRKKHTHSCRIFVQRILLPPERYAI